MTAFMTDDDRSCVINFNPAALSAPGFFLLSATPRTPQYACLTTPMIGQFDLAKVSFAAAND
jgi:hypothetical protein